MPEFLAMLEDEVFEAKKLEYQDYVNNGGEFSFDEWIRTEKNLPQQATQIIKK